ncbi:MAG: hypothetical protein IT385_15790 [Deltaproteobacteria bacterium]|nr:hypothetical protein [Deltaproteobacteria bacterium]
MTQPPRPQDEATRVGREPFPADPDDDAPPPAPPGLDAALGFSPLEPDAEVTSISVAEVRLGPGSGLVGSAARDAASLRPPTSETRRPTDRFIVPPPIPRPHAPPLEVEPVAPLRGHDHPVAPVSTVTRPGMPAHTPTAVHAAAPQARSGLIKRPRPLTADLGAPPPPDAPLRHAPSPPDAPLPWSARPASDVVAPEPAPWRRDPEDSDPAFALPGRLLAQPLPERPRTATAARPRVVAPDVLSRATLATLALLFVAAALPSRAGPPWELALRPADPSFVALMALVLVAVVRLVPVAPRTRGALALAVGTVTLALALAVLSHEAASAFDHQPALFVLFSATPAIGIALVLAATIVPAGLFLRTLAPRHMAATGLVGFGAALVLAVAFGVGGIFPEPPVVLLVDGITGATFLGDRVAAAATMPALVLLAGCLAFTFPGLGRTIAAPIGVLLWGLAFAPALVLAAFVATASDWLAVLGPVKLIVLVAAAALYLAAALASVLLGPGATVVTRRSPAPPAS